VPIRQYFLAAAALSLGCGATVDAEEVDYLRDIKPLLASHCHACHGPLQQKSGLRLDTAASALRGGESGPAIMPGKAAESLLYQAVTGEAGFQMPPEGEATPLDDRQRSLLAAWINQGAPAPADEQPLEDPR
jgi:mono/diheme cytochrome c family protein